VKRQETDSVSVGRVGGGGAVLEMCGILLVCIGQ